MGVEHIVAKGEIALYDQLLPFLQRFQLYSVNLLSFEEIVHPFYTKLHFDAFTTYNFWNIYVKEKFAQPIYLLTYTNTALNVDMSM